MAQSETAVLELRPKRDEQAVQQALETIVQVMRNLCNEPGGGLGFNPAPRSLPPPQSLAHDPVTSYLCREGQAESFMRALLASYLDSDASLLVVATPDFRWERLACPPSLQRAAARRAVHRSCFCCLERLQVLLALIPLRSAAALLEEVRGEQQPPDQCHDGSGAGATPLPPALAAALQRPAALQRLKQQPRLEELAARHGGTLSVHFVAVAPGMQGRGLGSRLLRGVCATADARALPLYLEATTERSKVGRKLPPLCSGSTCLLCRC